MNKHIQSHTQKYRDLDRTFIYSLITALVFLALSLAVNYFSAIYTTNSASSSVSDIVLSNTRAYDVDGMFVYGPLFFWAFIFLVCMRRPRTLPFTIKAISLFTVIRSVFVMLTHLGPFPTQIVITAQNIFASFSSGNDLFFSGHTGLPFLMALLFWKNLPVRIICLASAIFFGIVVLLGHLHYSIDVLSAFFITYTIFHMAEFLFKKDKVIFDEALA